MLSHINTLNIPYKILAVDDEEYHRKLEKLILSAPEFELSFASNGAEALSAIQQNDFDVVLLDKRMPGMDGDNVCEYIRHELEMELLPVIMVTGSSSQEELEKSLLAGANDFVRKPYVPMELVARVRSAAYNKRLTDQLDDAESVLFALARMVEAKDENTGNHCSRLEHMAEVFGKELGMESQQIQALKRGGVLHDIGKLGVPDSILLSKDPLTNIEWGIMRKHCEIGERLCRGLKSMKATLPIIKYHHERFDGSGYPEGLKGNDIPYLARVFQIIDIYDALAFARPYKKAFDQEKIIAILKEETRKGWRDPELVGCFLKLLNDRPESLVLDDRREKDLGSKIFERIVATERNAGVFKNATE